MYFFSNIDPSEGSVIFLSHVLFEQLDNDDYNNQSDYISAHFCQILLIKRFIIGLIVVLDLHLNYGRKTVVTAKNRTQSFNEYCLYKEENKFSKLRCILSSRWCITLIIEMCPVRKTDGENLHIDRCAVNTEKTVGICRSDQRSRIRWNWHTHNKVEIKKQMPFLTSNFECTRMQIRMSSNYYIYHA